MSGPGGRVLGVDFSGAARPGRALWLAEGRWQGDGLAIEAVFAAGALPGAGRDRAEVYRAVRRWLHDGAPAVAGLDFPFSLPAPVLDRLALADWGELVAWISGLPDAEAFRGHCDAASAGLGQRRRRTDVAARTPFSPYNLRIFRQTFHGIRDILAPLVADPSVAVAGVRPVAEARLVLAECCPASTLKAAQLYAPYKGTGAQALAARARLAGCLADCGVRLAPGLADRLVVQSGGDALDAVLAALGALRAARSPDFPAPGDALEAREARVFY